MIISKLCFYCSFICFLVVFFYFLFCCCYYCYIFSHPCQGNLRSSFFSLALWIWYHIYQNFKCLSNQISMVQFSRVFNMISEKQIIRLNFVDLPKPKPWFNKITIVDIHKTSKIVFRLTVRLFVYFWCYGWDLISYCSFLDCLEFQPYKI